MKTRNRTKQKIVSRIFALLLSSAAFTISTANAQAPGIVGVDHVGLNVPNLDQAVRFFHDMFGFEPVTKLGPFPMDTNWKKTYHIHDNAGSVTLIMMRAGDGSNLELFEYTPGVGSIEQPYRDDISASHFALYTTNIDSSRAFMESHGVKFIGGTNSGFGDTEGERWAYCETPWGATIELNTYPNGKGYEKRHPAVRLWTQPLAVQLTTESVDKTDLQQLAAKQVGVWNDTDSLNRLAKMKEIYNEDIIFFDHDGQLTGIASLNDRITRLQQKNTGFKFHLIKVDNSNNVVRYYWTYGPSSKPDLIAGMDLIILEGNKIRSLNVFLDRLPPSPKH